MAYSHYTFIVFIAVILMAHLIDAKSSLDVSSLSLKKPINAKTPRAEDKTKSSSEVVSVVGSVDSATKFDIRGPSSILGGALVHLTLGTLYCWGNFLSYSPPNLKFFDGKPHPGQQPDAVYVIPLTILFQAIAMPFGATVVKLIGTRLTLLSGALLTAAATYLSSYQTNLSSFMLFYSALFGLGVGLSYVSPMIAGWSYMPNAKGLVSGGVLAGFGAGGFFFSLIGSKIANPKQLNMMNGAFPSEVYENFPKMLRKLGVYYAILSFIGSLLVFEPKPTLPGASDPVTNSKTKAAPPVKAPSTGLSIIEAVKSSQFWLLWIMIVSSATTGLNTASIFKQYAISAPALAGDQFQSFVGGVGALFNGSGRLLWGSLSDKIGFKKSFTLLTLLQMISMLTYSHSSKSKSLFAVNTCSLFFCLAGNLALMPPATQKIFGPKDGATIYGILYSAFAVASIVGGVLTKKLAIALGWNGLFAVMAAMSLVATFLVQFLTPVLSYPSSSI